MQCDKCGRLDSKVIETRRLKRTVFRRRECKPCGERWWTQEAHVNSAPSSLHEMSTEAQRIRKEEMHGA